ncbi:putative prolin-rich transmembrane protein [Thiomonas delicata]|uniref:Putative prolin-rich transmembrane protein n=2 Tax=Thiomonas delicata TaxID=364030 RepID=A0A238D8N3_THIDL|nr:putative prolin-rich transmembrane protein [Thiomonas delicata]
MSVNEGVGLGHSANSWRETTTQRSESSMSNSSRPGFWHRLHLAFGAAVLMAFAMPAWADPPALVARMDLFEGTATLLPAGSSTWTYANINRPLSDGDQVWIGAASRAELVAGSTAMRLGANTSLSVLELSDAATQLKLTQGTFEVHLREPMQGRSFEIDTPNLAFDLQTPGDYRVDVDPGQNTTTVIVRAGEGIAYGTGGASYPVGRRQLVRFSGTALIPDEAVLNPPFDGFDRWVGTLNRREGDSISARYVGTGMTGYQGLDQYGRWETDPLYGPIWVPTAVVAGWAPYHDGHWAWIAPWGWTWIDDEPWGFAPFHYGRWAYVGNVWAWVPGPVIMRPVYAPALVAFIGGGGGSWSVSLSIGAPGIAWFPLAPGEIYRPVYAASPTYVNAINRTVIVNKTVTVVNNTTVINNIQRNVYINQRVPGAITAMPAAAFVRGRRVQYAGAPFRAVHVTAAHVLFSPPIAPVEQSLVGHKLAAPPPHGAFERTVFATRSPPPPPALHDTLAQRFKAQNGTAPGAGHPLVLHVPAQIQSLERRQRITVIQGHEAAESQRPMPAQDRALQSQSPTHAPDLEHRNAEVPPGRFETEPNRRVLNAVPHPTGSPMPRRDEQRQQASPPHPRSQQGGERPFNTEPMRPVQSIRPELHAPARRQVPVERPGPAQFATHSSHPPEHAEAHNRPEKKKSEPKLPDSADLLRP